MTVREIIIEKLRNIGADGLCREGCGCGIDDFPLCIDLSCNCVPAKRRIATEPGEYHEIGDTIYEEMK